MNRGTVQIPKEIINRHHLYKDPVRYTFLGYLFDNRSGCPRVLKNHRGIRGLNIHLEKGQLAITYSWLMADLGLSKKQVRLLMEWVEKEVIFSAKIRAQQRAQQGAQQYTVLTYVFQDVVEESDQTGAQQNERQRAHSSNKYPIIAKNEKKEKTSASLPSAEFSPVKTDLPEKANHKVDTTVYIDLFRDLVEQRFGFKPDVGSSSTAPLRRFLKQHGKEETVEIIRGYVASDKAERLGCTLSHAFTDHTHNMLKQGVGNSGGQSIRKRSLPDRDDTMSRQDIETDAEVERINARRRARLQNVRGGGE